MFLSCLDGIHRWALTLLLYGNAAGLLLSNSSLFFRSILLFSSSFLCSVPSGLQASFPLSFSTSFPLVAPCPLPLWGTAFPQFPCSLTLESFKLYSSSLWKLPIFVSLFCLVTFSSISSLFLEKKAEELQEAVIRFSLITETVSYAECGSENTSASVDLEKDGYTWKRERWQKPLDCWEAFPALGFVHTGSKQTE